MFQKVQEVILWVAAVGHKFLDLSLGQGDQMMLCPINYQKLGPFNRQTSSAQSFTCTKSTCPSSLQQQLSKVVCFFSYFYDISVCWEWRRRFQLKDGRQSLSDSAVQFVICNSIILLWYISMIFLWYVYDIYLIFIWYLFDISMIPIERWSSKVGWLCCSVCLKCLPLLRTPVQPPIETSSGPSEREPN